MPPETSGAKTAQRLVDPEVCVACYSCFEVCPTGAVEIHGRRVAINPALCDDCGACVAECCTDAIDVTRPVTNGIFHDVAEQLSWDSLPPEGV